MSVYVDPLRAWPDTAIQRSARKHGSRWAHMTADTREELHDFAARLGLKRGWFQDHSTRWHYDITAGKWPHAVRLGARVISTRELVMLHRTTLQNSHRRNSVGGFQWQRPYDR